MKTVYSKWALSLAVGTGVVLGAFGTAGTAHAIKKGGILNFVVGSKIPSYDGHVENTFGMIHPIRPFYSLLIRINPDNPSSPTDFICDLCEGDVPKGEDGFTKYTFKIRTGVKFHDGTPLTSADIVATYQKIIFPPEGIASARRTFFKMVESGYRAGRDDRGLQAEVPVGRLHSGRRHAVQLRLFEEGPG